MHQPHADRNVFPHQPVADKRWPLPRFPIGQGRAGPAKQRSLCFSHTASSINMPHCLATSHCHATITANHHLPKVLTKSDAAKTSPSYATRDLPRQARERDNLPKQGILSDPSFCPAGSLRFDPPQLLATQKPRYTRNTYDRAETHSTSSRIKPLLSNCFWTRHTAR